MKNSEIAAILYDIADMLEMQGVAFKPVAYRKAARSIEEHSESLEQLYAAGGRGALLQVKGVGEGIADKLEELLKTGKLKYYSRLRKNFPEHISALMEVPGLGPKKIKVLHEKLRIKGIDDLRKAASAHRIAGLGGFGERTEQEILKGIELVEAGRKRMLLGHALPLAREVEARLESLPFVDEAVVAGSLRRRQETIGDLDLLAVSKSPAKVMDFFTSMDDVKRVLAKGSTKSSILLSEGVQVDLRVVPAKSFGAALQYFSGSIPHNVKLRELAIKKGWKLNEYGLFDRKGGFIAGKSEAEVYNKLGMDYIEPELRAGAGEIDAAMSHKLPKLVGYSEIRGDLHTHTVKSDGANRLGEMVAEARQLGYEYIAITDHSVSERVAHGLPEADMQKWIAEIRKFTDSEKGIRVLAGSEVSIRKDGSLDYSDSLLKKMDMVVASVHSGFKSERDEMTKRVLAALDNEHVDILGHPTGRLISRREPLDFDFKAVVRKAVDKGVLLEINAHPDRLDLRDSLIREAKGLGAKFVINTDSHSVANLSYMEYGVGQARRGWLEKEDVANTSPFSELKRFFRRLR